jgi:YHS domain-containing protein
MAVYRNQAYWFCCSGCQSNFEKEPERYLRPIVA